MRKIILILVTAIVCAGIAGFWYSFDFLFVPPGKASEKVVFEVPNGSSFSYISTQLKEKGIIKDDFKFKLLAKALGYTNKLRLGEYELHLGMKPRQILVTLASGKSIQYKVTFKEGINIYEIADKLEDRGFYKKDEFLEVVKDPLFTKELLGENFESLEGYLFPETYTLTKYTPVKSLVRLMVKNFEDNYAAAVTNAGIKMNKHEIVILASMIEKETGAPEERPRISSVFHNRLKKKMRLQSDPTIIYGMMEQTGEYVKNIRKKDITAPTRYNTYTVKALPVGPIANPGKHSLEAAVNPETTDYLYFVSRNDGTHKFTTNYKAHQKAVKEYQLNAKAREGKSWRDLNKRKKVNN